MGRQSCQTQQACVSCVCICVSMCPLDQGQLKPGMGAMLRPGSSRGGGLSSSLPPPTPTLVPLWGMNGSGKLEQYWRGTGTGDLNQSNCLRGPQKPLSSPSSPLGVAALAPGQLQRLRGLGWEWGVKCHFLRKTSLSHPTSTRVSSGFALPRHSSPSFGS